LVKSLLRTEGDILLKHLQSKPFYYIHSKHKHKHKNKEKQKIIKNNRKNQGKLIKTMNFNQNKSTKAPFRSRRLRPCHIDYTEERLWEPSYLRVNK